MKKYGKLLGTVFALIAVIGLASFAYGKLKENTEIPAPMVNEKKKMILKNLLPIKNRKQKILLLRDKKLSM